MKAIVKIISLIIITIMFTFSVNADLKTELSDEYWVTSCWDAETNTGKLACVDWEASIVSCDAPSWPCTDVVVSG